jgi:hypothetical protein
MDITAKEPLMCVALIGATDRLNSSFRESAARVGFDLWFLNGPDLDMASRIEGLDALVIMTDQVSPRVKEDAMKVARTMCIPAFCTTCEGAALCGISSIN